MHTQQKMFRRNSEKKEFRRNSKKAISHCDVTQRITKEPLFHWYPYYKETVIESRLSETSRPQYQKQLLHLHASHPSLAASPHPQTGKGHPRDPWNENFGWSFPKFLSKSTFTGDFGVREKKHFNREAQTLLLLKQQQNSTVKCSNSTLCGYGRTVHQNQYKTRNRYCFSL